jgi:hypothetical protein
MEVVRSNKAQQILSLARALKALDFFCPITHEDIPVLAQ